MKARSLPAAPGCRHKELARQKFEAEKHRQEEAAERQRRQAYDEAQVCLTPLLL